MKKKSLDKISCPIERVAQLLSDRWTILIVRDLLDNKKRFCELERSLEEISTRTLTTKLKRLQKIGLVEHKDSLYFLSKKGEKLQEILTAMAHYGKRYLQHEKQKI